MSSSGMLSRPGECKPVVSEQGLALGWGEVFWGNAGKAGCEPDLTEGEHGTG